MAILCDLNCQNNASYRIKSIPSGKYVNFCKSHTEVLEKMGYIHEE